MVTNFATVWHEEADDPNFDLWARFEVGGPGPMFGTKHRSMFPHVAGYWASDTFHCLTIWTEATEDSLVFAVTFGDYVLEPLDEGCYEPGSFYAVEVGETKPSPYCTRRGGFKEYRSHRVDSAASELVYQLPYLNPRYSYLLRAVFYHEGKETWTAELRCDSATWMRVALRPNVPETVWARIPQQAYQRDARIELSLRKVSGGFVSLAGLKLFQRESRDKGFELAAVGGTGPSARLFHARPNPFSTQMAVQYGLAVPGRVSVDVLDATGRVVCKLVDADLAAGEHQASWGGRDAWGRVVPAGVYFCRVQTPDAAVLDRVVLLR